MKPFRVQLSRKKGFKLPPNTVVVSRPGKWGNAYRIGEDVPGLDGVKMDAEDAVAFFKFFQLPKMDVSELRGKNLACWCKLESPCHADALIEVANA